MNFTFEWSGEFIAFFVLAVCAIVGSVMALSLTKVVHTTLSLAFTFISLAGLYVLLNAEFVAFVQVLIYVGAITILMIFGIMMTKHQEAEEKPRPLLESLAAIGCICLLALLIFAIRDAGFALEAGELPPDSTREIGKLLFTKMVIPFELISVLLTVAFIGAIAIAKREEDPE
jgi:NADH-quinone oxidoreductase subunit J